MAPLTGNDFACARYCSGEREACGLAVRRWPTEGSGRRGRRRWIREMSDVQEAKNCSDHNQPPRRLPPLSAIMEGRRRLYRVARSYCQIWRSTTEMANPLIRFSPTFGQQDVVILISASVGPSTRWLFLMREREGRWTIRNEFFAVCNLAALARSKRLHPRKERQRDGDEWREYFTVVGIIGVTFTW